MNRMIKGALVGATGVALLSGGVGTFALWSSETGVDNATVTSGKLKVESGGVATWLDKSTNPDGVVFNPATSTIVPGDVIEMTQPLDVTATGTNLKAKVELTGLTESFANLTVTFAYAGKSVSSSADGSGSLVLDYTTAADLTALSAGTAATVTYSFPSSVTGVVDQNVTAQLANAKVVVTQVR